MSIPLWLWMCEGRDRCRCATDLGVSLAWCCCTTKDAVCMYEFRGSCKTHSLVRAIDPMLPIHTFWKALPYDRVREAKAAMPGTLRPGRHSVRSEALSVSCPLTDPSHHVPQNPQFSARLPAYAWSRPTPGILFCTAKHIGMITQAESRNRLLYQYSDPASAMSERKVV
jgi:hypothetical protein